MTIYNLGSINIDYIYTLPHLVKPGETLASNSFLATLGGKGANQSIAISKAGGNVKHAGLINGNDKIWLSQLEKSKVNTENILFSEKPTGHAIIAVDEKSGDNQIILYPSCNNLISKKQINKFLKSAQKGDWALTQNETNLTEYFLKLASKMEMFICYSAAPFVPSKTIELLPIVDLLILNEIELEELLNFKKTSIKNLGVPNIIVTMGDKGVKYIGRDVTFFVLGEKVNAIDTTGAGDTFLGYFLANFDKTKNIKEAIEIANLAASIQVTRKGTSKAIPNYEEVLKKWRNNIK